MSLTPSDILQRRFPKRFRGYDPAEVDAFLEEVARALTDAVREQNALKDRVAAYKAQLVALRKQERELRGALTSAHRLAEDMKAQAERDAELTLERARLDADRVVEERRRELFQIEEEIRGLRRLRREALLRIRGELEHYLALLEQGETLEGPAETPEADEARVPDVAPDAPPPEFFDLGASLGTGSAGAEDVGTDRTEALDFGLEPEAPEAPAEAAGEAVFLETSPAEAAAGTGEPAADAGKAEKDAGEPRGGDTPEAMAGTEPEDVADPAAAARAAASS
ncbi:DivIVA domain-containing protein [Dissulfurirhabdus thermomarina]|uniref:DivIVA domain-containing protein n=1 Tax=Dissulfurirhabdus thermomarina TaxID=1765737 RepID=A0A6N9TN70_DISTH|nr:DivIVA domain-containing protein [Dissulfurirhabdus thermomarina]NDY42589.1 DivIVA domain-containing protein [Dissulfurirhabdus thermomarina]NMX24479.1 DivIVA domain-containing protein [Dissulfurirhabdus thermomarina]